MRIKTFDPVYRKPASFGPFSRLALHFINDARDLPFIWFLIRANAFLIPAAAWLFFAPRFNPWFGVAYLAVNRFVFGEPFTLLLHNTSHRPLFKKQYRLLNSYIPWLVAPFFGHSPGNLFRSPHRNASS